MTSEGDGSGDRASDHRHHPAGSRHSRLAAAEKQLAIVLEDVDLDAEPALAEAVTDAVAAVDRARRAAEDAENEGEPARSDVDGEEIRDEEAPPSATREERRERTLQQLVREAHAE